MSKRRCRDKDTLHIDGIAVPVGRKVVCDADGNPALIGRDEHGKATTVEAGGEVVELDDHRPHAVGYAVCDCGWWCVSTVDMRADFDHLECGGCGQMTAALQANAPADVVPLKPRR